MNIIFIFCRCHVRMITFILLVTIGCVIGTGFPDVDTDRKAIKTGKIIDTTFDYGNRVAVIAVSCKTGTFILAD